MRKHVYIASFLIGLAAISAVRAFAQGNFREGKWEVTMNTRMDNMPGMSDAMSALGGAVPGMGSSITATNCVTNQDPYPDSKNLQGCQVPKVQWDGNSVDYEVTCDRQGTQMTIKARMTYTGDTLTGYSKAHMVMQGQAMDSTTTFNGKYLGACD